MFFSLASKKQLIVIDAERVIIEEDSRQGIAAPPPPAPDFPEISYERIQNSLRPSLFSIDNPCESKIILSIFNDIVFLIVSFSNIQASNM